GTYAALGCGMIGNYFENQQVNTGEQWSETGLAAKVIQDRCVSCHEAPARLLPRTLADERGVSFWQPSLDDPRLLTSRHIVFNLTRPEKSMILLAPLAKAAGGWGLCVPSGQTNAPAVFQNTADPGYQALLALCNAGKTFLQEKSPRFDMPEFTPPEPWVREMKRYGILPAESSTGQSYDVYKTEQAYWKSLWHQPVSWPVHSVRH
ncbi:MAG TPA: hypothetical protein VN673_12495, partial [Clostridia bacterium]|nr:hypothetical protein [Clostridia bacterium]